MALLSGQIALLRPGVGRGDEAGELDVGRGREGARASRVRMTDSAPVREKVVPSAPIRPEACVKALPKTEQALVLRTELANDDAWARVRDAIREPAGEFRAYVEFVEDPAFDGASVEELLQSAADGPYRSFLFVVDATALSDSEHPVLVIDLHASPGRTFRVIPAEMWSVENNLSIGNMDFEEFAESVDGDGVFRGFRD